ncbi:MAG: hypothetical protein J5630_00835 [Bacteroidaceae bacterium]|nr:hypothetical protein [Bacteroidaceae bacterium]
MGKNAGGSGTGKLGDSRKKTSKSLKRFLKGIKDYALRKDQSDAFNLYAEKFGIRANDIKITNNYVEYGITGLTADGRIIIELNAKFFAQRKKAVEKAIIVKYRAGESVSTKQPSKHVLTHELAHATWRSDYTGQRHIEARSDIYKLFSDWKSNRSAVKYYGALSKTHIDEFWAEVVTKALYGTPDEYTKRARSIIKKHRL